MAEFFDLIDELDAEAEAREQREHESFKESMHILTIETKYYRELFEKEQQKNASLRRKLYKLKARCHELEVNMRCAEEGKPFSFPEYLLTPVTSVWEEPKIHETKIVAENTSLRNTDDSSG